MQIVAALKFSHGTTYEEYLAFDVIMRKVYIFGSFETIAYAYTSEIVIHEPTARSAVPGVSPGRG